MEKISYKNRTKEVNELTQYILNNDYRVIIYHSKEGYGNTAFISRIQFLLQTTKSLQVLSAELSPHNTNSLQIITRNIVCKDNELYHTLQMFSDEENGIYSIPFSISTVVRDLTQSDTIASLFVEKEAAPIYTGFYQDRLKENFFKLISSLSNKKRIVLFIDNIQYMDNESIYELNSLCKKDSITLVLFKSGESNNFDKFYYEIEYKIPCVEIDFPEPNIKYAQELATIYDRNLTNEEASRLIFESQKNIRKLLYLIRKQKYNYTLSDFEFQIVKTLFIHNDFLSEEDLFQICNYSPYSAVFTKRIIADCLNKLEANNVIFSVLSVSDSQKKYKVLSNYKPQIDLADSIIICKALLQYYYKNERIDYNHLNQAFRIATEQKEIEMQLYFATKIVKSALQMGYIVDDEIVEVLSHDKTNNSMLLAGTYCFCNARYQRAKDLFDKLLIENDNRSIKVMYAISLNRCRLHCEAEQNLLNLISTSENADEQTILVSFLISNYVHSGNINQAKTTFEMFNDKLKSCNNYPYFLRNAATIFGFDKANKLRLTAKSLFKEKNDLFGYYTTIINLSPYYIKADFDYAVNQIQMSFEELQQYNAQQIHLAANNLGICYLYKENYLLAMKYFNLAIEIAKTIMPITYASINLSNLYIKMGKIKAANDCIIGLDERVSNSNLPRLKARYYYQSALIKYIDSDFYTASKKIDLAKDHSYSTTANKYLSSLLFLSQKIQEKTVYSENMWDDLFSPCYLEYWTINSIDVLDNNFLPC